MKGVIYTLPWRSMKLRPNAAGRAHHRRSFTSLPIIFTAGES